MNYKVTDIKVEELPFSDFLTSRYSMTVRVNVDKTYEMAKKEKIPFFNLTTACILEVINEIPEFKLRIKDNAVIEYEHINAVSPIMQNDHTIREIEIVPPSKFENIYEWSNYVENKKANIEENQFIVEPMKRDECPIANLSCIPWIDFDSMTNIIASSNQIMPVISWGKMVDGKIPISLTASHVFIFGWHFKLFYENVEDYLNNPERLF
ncbi:MAG: chloramphenicol acetyltransferase [Methanobrevibacter sp.]|uniref:CatA-like O-acetyltransferase n=1 Tax=Methanobrevibacter sp. TaxID=66852 RepID=UPI0025FA15BA|nr:CatA-like O-acetyltransferase [Methanobrevibacter sp.]MBR0270774.1 chloramphenicol acetyltransferase [Methanobrevibacter sp.]